MEMIVGMIKSARIGIFLVLILISSAIVAGIPSISAAENIEASSIAFENTTIIEFTNTGDKPINMFRMWLGSDFNFKSFKTESGWIGDKTPQGVIVFTSDEPVMPGDSIKFGVKTDEEKPGINWKALAGDEEVDLGITLADELPKPEKKTVSENPTNEIQNKNTNGISEDSTFRIIPEKPNVGSSIRVTGDEFAPDQEFDFYIDNKKLKSFETDASGYFITTTEIPNDAEAERVEFIVKDSKGNQKSISLRLNAAEDRVPETDNIKLTINGIDSVIHRGEKLEPSGTAQPESTVTATIKNPEGKETTKKTAEVSAKGVWKVEPIIVPSDAPLGEYVVEISDGREKITETYEVKTDKVIILSSAEVKYEVGDIMKFNGTAIPNEPLEVVIEDPINQEVFSDIIEVGESGYVEITVETTNDFEEGTYTLFASQGTNLELIYAGLGQFPQVPVNIQFSKLNYKNTEDAQLIVSAEPSETVSLLLVDPSDNPVGETVQIKIGPDGRGTHYIDLDDFATGVYSAVVNKGTARSSATFTVGLQLGAGDISINTTKEEYKTGDQILVLGTSNPNILLNLSMMDPEGNIIKERESYSDKDGRISNNAFRIPANALPGTWSIKAASGANFDIIEFEVVAVNEEGMVVFVEEGDNYAGLGDSINIRVIGAKQTVDVEIISPEQTVIEQLSFPASDEGEVNIPWIIPKDAEPGTYTIKVEDPFDSAEATYELE